MNENPSEESQELLPSVEVMAVYAQPSSSKELPPQAIENMN